MLANHLEMVAITYRLNVRRKTFIPSQSWQFCTYSNHFSVIHFLIFPIYQSFSFEYYRSLCDMLSPMYIYKITVYACQWLMPPCCGGELRVLSFIFNLSSFSLLVHYGLIADQTPVDSCWARSTILALASIQRLYLTPCPPIKRISFAFWASMERIINDRQTIRHQVNSVKALRNKQMYACFTMRKSILSVCVCVFDVCIPMNAVCVFCCCRFWWL